ncbi:MAG: HypC/HybG/HupF family hydrogenase formation chaperone, partial [Candidatus Omnitrophica bacterium]|nr:HypC/HybG/HupF family hydrogenase formation chaperone [Candidatus Omnitrophota bacterium]
MCLAVPARIKKVDKGNAEVDFGGVAKRISLGILSGVKKGDYVLVHAGFAIGKVSAEEAA